MENPTQITITNAKRYTIIRNDERYSLGTNSREILPGKFVVEGLSYEQAQELAERLSNRHAGCDYAFYIDGDPEGGS